MKKGNLFGKKELKIAQTEDIQWNMIKHFATEKGQEKR